MSEQERLILRSIRGAAKRREKADTAKRQATEDLRASASKRRRRASRLRGSLLRPVFPARVFTTCWRSDLSQVGVELAFGRDRNLEALGGLLLGALDHDPRVATTSEGQDLTSSARQALPSCVSAGLVGRKQRRDGRAWLDFHPRSPPSLPLI